MDGWQSEGNQLDAVNSETDVVTLTIGGNNVEFATFVENCLTPGTGGCAEGTESYNLAMQRIDQLLPGHLATLFGQIQTQLTSGNTTAKVYVVGYPMVIRAGYSSCSYTLLGANEQQAAQNITYALNSKIYSAVNATLDWRFKYVPADEQSSPFYGHDMCDANSYFNSLDLQHEVYTAHPNVVGQQAYATLIKNFMQNN